MLREFPLARRSNGWVSLIMPKWQLDWAWHDRPRLAAIDSASLGRDAKEACPADGNTVLSAGQAVVTGMGNLGERVGQLGWLHLKLPVLFPVFV